MTVDRQIDLATVQSGGTLGSSLIAAMRRYPHRPAIADGEVSWTYRELERQLAALVAVFKAEGVRPGDGIGVLTGNRAEGFAASVAAMLMGARYTPLHPAAAEEDHAFIVSDAELKAIVVEPVRYGVVGLALARRQPGLRLFSLGPTEGAIDLRQATASVPDPQLHDEATPQSIAYLAYTGGTTGRPKGVILSHRVFASMLVHQGHDWEWPQEIRFLASSPITHMAGSIIYTVLAKGGYTRLVDRFDPVVFFKTAKDDRITAALLVPTMIYALLDHPSLSGHDVSTIKLIIYGAAPMSPDRLAQALDAFGPVFLQVYAQTEAVQGIATLRQSDHALNRPERLSSCGIPGPLVTVKLLDEEMQEVPTGQPGEICVRGPIVMDGYWKQPDATAEALRGGWLHTGDVAVQDDDGYLTIVDRLKDMIVTGGFNVYPREVEDALLSHPSVASAAVIGTPDAKWGEAVRAFVMIRPGASFDETGLRDHVKSRRGSISAPKIIERVDEIPLTPLGKVDRKRLRAPFWSDRERSVG